MKQFILLLSFTFTLLFGLSAAPGIVRAADDIEQHRDCLHCGMDRKSFGYSRMLVVYDDGRETGLCSLNCVVTELDANQGKKVKALLVADRESRELVAAEQAVWVMGGSKRGVMTVRPKWAFANKEGAERFMKESGGAIISWERALAAAREDAGSGHR